MNYLNKFQITQNISPNKQYYLYNQSPEKYYQYNQSPEQYYQYNQSPDSNIQKYKSQNKCQKSVQDLKAIRMQQEKQFLQYIVEKQQKMEENPKAYQPTSESEMEESNIKINDNINDVCKFSVLNNQINQKFDYSVEEEINQNSDQDEFILKDKNVNNNFFLSEDFNLSESKENEFISQQKKVINVDPFVKFKTIEQNLNYDTKFDPFMKKEEKQQYLLDIDFKINLEQSQLNEQNLNKSQKQLDSHEILADKIQEIQNNKSNHNKEKDSEKNIQQKEQNNNINLYNIKDEDENNQQINNFYMNIEQSKLHQQQEQSQLLIDYEINNHQEKNQIDYVLINTTKQEEEFGIQSQEIEKLYEIEKSHENQSFSSEQQFNQPQQEDEINKNQNLTENKNNIFLSTQIAIKQDIKQLIEQNKQIMNEIKVPNNFNQIFDTENEQYSQTIIQGTKQYTQVSQKLKEELFIDIEHLNDNSTITQNFQDFVNKYLIYLQKNLNIYLKKDLKIIYNFKLFQNRKQQKIKSQTFQLMNLLQQENNKKKRNKLILKRKLHQKQLKQKEFIFDQLFKSAKAHKRWIDAVRQQMMSMKLVNIMRFWKFYTYGKILEKHVDQFYLNLCFTRFKKQIKLNKEKSSNKAAKQNQMNLLKTTFKKWQEYHKKMQKQIKQKTQQKKYYLKKLIYKCFKNWKKYVKINQENDFIPIKICIKNKVFLNKTNELNSTNRTQMSTKKSIEIQYLNSANK